MPGEAYLPMIARYNLWQNAAMTAAAGTLTDAERQADRGVFFGSIQRTFSHLFWADQAWLAHFTGTPAPGGGIADSLDLINDWAEFCAARSALDRRILAWADSAGNDTGPALNPAFVIQFFNHQTHHRGQIHAMLTAAGAATGDTDIHKMPKAYLDL